MWFERNVGPLVGALVFIGVVALIVAALVQESHDVNVTEGRVTKLEYTPEHTEHWTTEGQCYVRTDSGFCVARGPDEHHSRHYAARWRVWITDDVDNDGDLDTDWYTIGQNVYDQLNEGDWYRVGYGRVRR